MKKLIFVLAAVSIITVQQSKAQKQIKEGKVEYELTYEGIDEQYAAYMPKGKTISFKDQKNRTDMQLGMGMNQTIIYDGEKKERFMLQDMMGKKAAIKMDSKEKKDADPKVEKTAETKTIAGYKCNKVIITDEEGNKTELWVTKDIIAAHDESEYKGVDGFMMEANISLSNQGMEGTMIMAAKKVSPEKIDSKQFEIPADYKVMTQEEFRKMMTGGGGIDE